MVVSNGNLLFQGAIFRGYVSFREGISLGFQTPQAQVNAPKAPTRPCQDATQGILWIAKGIANIMTNMIKGILAAPPNG